MRKNRYWLGIDLGTTGLKALLVDAKGKNVGLGYKSYPINVPYAGHAEQAPEVWLDALRDALAQAMHEADATADSVVGIGFSGQMHGLVAVGKDHGILHPAILWCDQRTQKQVESIRRVSRPEWTANPVAVGFQLPSWLWMLENEPDIAEKTHKLLTPKDALRMLLTGECATEVTDASGTGLFDCVNRRWSHELIEALRLDASVLPESSYLPQDIAGTLTKDAAQLLGLRAGIPVAFGGADQPMQAVGNGILRPGDIAVTLGTGGQVFAPLSAPAVDPALCAHMFCHAPEDTWYGMGAILNACLAQNWFFEKVLGTNDAAAMHTLAAQVETGCGGLRFLPYLTGERTPLMDPEATGAFVGLRLGHTRADMVRAVLEGVAFALRDAYDALLAFRPVKERIILSGGGARSALWRQILADMLECPVTCSGVREQAAGGAALCAMVATGEYRDLQEACNATIAEHGAMVEPIARNTEIYAQMRAAGVHLPI